MRHLYLSILLAIGLPGCGGGADPGGLSAEPQTLVVQYDRDDDGELDWVTLDTTTQPFTVVEALQGTANGDPLDMTDLLAGTPIDPDLSLALADHLARSFAVGERTELEVLLGGARRMTVAVLD
ncbi:MAG: hypothetical protein ACYTEG_08315 [Planctomycetota bacterium]|jgi:hypothetical protein